MFNFALMNYEVEQAMEQANRPATEAELFLAEMRAAGHTPARRKLADLMMRFALKLDPSAAPRALTLEAAHVRD
jgi:hypothetical protein